VSGASSVPSAREQRVSVRGVSLWCRISGDGEPVLQIHGSGFGHQNFAPVTPLLARRYQVVDFDLRGYGNSERPEQHYEIETWADDTAALIEALGFQKAHIHGTSMGGMVAIALAGKYPERVASVVINCAAAKLGRAGRLVFENWIDIASMDPAGPGSRTLAELIGWQCLSRAYLERDDAQQTLDTIQRILTEANSLPVFIAACRAMQRMDLRPWLGQITAPALVIGGDEDLMTPWDQGPAGAGQQAIYEGIAGAERCVIPGSGHSTIFDNTERHAAAVLDFFDRHRIGGGS
jgi:pimeloyl-ACP methyl ester carboxylesterase